MTHRFLTHTLALAAATLVTGQAQAITVAPSPTTTATVEYTAVVLASNARNTSLALTQFDASLGTLRNVTLDLFATLDSTVKLESTNRAAIVPVTGKVTSVVSLLDGSNTSLTSATAVINTSFTGTTTYDGTLDYLGTSGRTQALEATASSSLSFSDAQHLALFTGTGSVPLTYNVASSVVYGGLGVRGQLTGTTVGGYARITYTYDKPVLTLQPTLAPVPEPGTWALMASGLGMVGLLASRRRRS